MLPPTKDGKPVSITNQVVVLQLSDFQTDRFTYDIEFILQQWWNDPRLAKNISNDEKSDHSVLNMHNCIWVPPMFVPTSVSLLKEEDRTVFMDFDHNGNIFKSQRQKLR